MFLNDFFVILTNMDNNSKFLLSMIILIIVLLVIIIIISAISAKKENERIKSTRKPTDKSLIEDKLKKLDFQINEAKETVVNEPIVQKEEVEEPEVKPIVQETKLPEPDFEEEIEVIEVEKNDIEDIAKQIENSKPKEFNLNEFEKEQEESAIISYDELVRKAGAKKIIYKEEKKETRDYNEYKEPKKSGFVPSKVVSPIYGVQNKEISKRATLTREERNKTLSTNDKEIVEDIEFLNSLKQFRRELE